MALIVNNVFPGNISGGYFIFLKCVVQLSTSSATKQHRKKEIKTTTKMLYEGTELLITQLAFDLLGSLLLEC